MKSNWIQSWAGRLKWHISWYYGAAICEILFNWVPAQRGVTLVLSLYPRSFAVRWQFSFLSCVLFFFFVSHTLAVLVYTGIEKSQLEWDVASIRIARFSARLKLWLISGWLAIKLLWFINIWLRLVGPPSRLLLPPAVSCSLLLPPAAACAHPNKTNHFLQNVKYCEFHTTIFIMFFYFCSGSAKLHLGQWCCAFVFQFVFCMRNNIAQKILHIVCNCK